MIENMNLTELAAQCLTKPSNSPYAAHGDAVIAAANAFVMHEVRVCAAAGDVPAGLRERAEWWAAETERAEAAELAHEDDDLRVGAALETHTMTARLVRDTLARIEHALAAPSIDDLPEVL